jgi:dCTP deaminase
MIRQGVLPSQMLKGVIGSGFLEGIEEKYINPASIDLPLSSEAYRLETVFLPKAGESVRDLLPLVGASKHDLKNPLEVGVSYIINVGRITLPSRVYAFANPKSSAGRINLFCRIVADNVGTYDTLRPAGYSGEVWILAEAGIFPVLLSPRQAVSQLRLFDGPSFLDPLELEFVQKKAGLIFDIAGKRLKWPEIRTHDDSIILSLAVAKRNPGLECRGLNRVLDFGKKGYPLKDFFSKVAVSDGWIKLRKDNLYILSTAERIMVPPDYSAELRATDERFGEFRSHTAGYIDPGWGYGEAGEKNGAQITLEVIPYRDLSVRHGQEVVRIRYEHMKQPPERAYDLVDSNYSNQIGPKHSKHFVE